VHIGACAGREASPRCRSPSCRSARSACRRGAANPVLTSRVVIQTAARLGLTPPQVALQWLLHLASSVLLIPRTGSAGHLSENLAAEHVTLDDQPLRELADAGAGPS
jgi:aryl-alcohol dehydrogenase-like predicted oxidoreductase